MSGQGGNMDLRVTRFSTPILFTLLKPACITTICNCCIYSIIVRMLCGFPISYKRYYILSYQYKTECTKILINILAYHFKPLILFETVDENLGICHYLFYSFLYYAEEIRKSARPKSFTFHVSHEMTSLPKYNMFWEHFCYKSYWITWKYPKLYMHGYVNCNFGQISLHTAIIKIHILPPFYEGLHCKTICIS